MFVMKSEILFWGDFQFVGNSPVNVTASVSPSYWSCLAILTAVVTVYITTANSAYLCVSFEIISHNDYIPKKR